MKYILLLSFLLLSFNLNSKELKCKIIDKNTKEILTGTKVRILNDSTTYFSNLYGIVTIKSKNNVDAIIVEYPTYDIKVVNYNTNKDTLIIVELENSKLFINSF